MDPRAAKYRKVDEETTPGENHPEDETTDGGKLHRKVDPNEKCLGCLHYDNTRSFCLVALVPTSCGSGSKPETGYAPLVVDAEAKQALRQKQGKPFNMRKSLHDTVQAFHAALKQHKPGSPEHTRILAAHANHAPLLHHLHKLGEAGSKVIHVMNRAANSTTNAGHTTPMKLVVKGDYRKAQVKFKICTHCGKRVTGESKPHPRVPKLVVHPECLPKMQKSLNAKDQKPDLCKCGGKLVKGVCAKCGPVEKSDSKWAIATAAWQKVSKEKKAKYVHAAMARHKKDGESIAPGKYASRAPREFMERIASKGGPSLTEEFGQGLAGFLYKSRRLIEKAGTIHLPAGPVSKPDAGGGMSPVLAAVRKRKQEAHLSGKFNATAHAKAKEAAGGKVFRHTSLAEAAGVKPDVIRDMALNAHHVHAFHQQVRQQFGEKVAHLTSGQIRSAYHSTGLEHSMRDANDVMKALKWSRSPSQGGEVHVGTAPHGKYTIQKFRLRYRAHGGESEKTFGERGGVAGLKMLASEHHRKQGTKKSLDVVEKGEGLPRGLSKMGGPGMSYGASHGTYSIRPSAKVGPNQKVQGKRGYKVHYTSRSGEVNVGEHHADLGSAQAAMVKHHNKHVGKSMTNLTESDLDLIKAHKAKRRHCIGHTSTGKPVHNDGFGAEALSTPDEHREAAELHSDVGTKLDRAASPYMGSDSKLPSAARKYLGTLATHHHNLAARHHATANKRISAPTPQAGITSPEPFGKSVVPLTMGALVNAPLNVQAPMHMRGELYSGVPSGTMPAAVAEEQPAPEVPEVRKSPPMVGGVLSSAWDFGQRY